MMFMQYVPICYIYQKFNQNPRLYACTVPQKAHDTSPQTTAHQKPYTGSLQDALPPRAMGRAIVPVALGTMNEKFTV